jgi:pyruvate kinase
MRKTKIVCTIGPACSSPEMIKKLLKSGMNVARLNFSHGSAGDHQKTYALLRSTAASMNIPLAIMQDLQGPKIRLGKLKDNVLELKEGSKVVLDVRKEHCDGRKIIWVTYASLARDVKPGDRLLIEDGKISLQVLESDDFTVTCISPKAQTLKSSKGINLPNVKVSQKSPTPKDIKDLQLGISLGVDFVALSFVRSVDEIIKVKQIIHKNHASIPVISKIERPEAIENLEDIIKASEGILVARGDLGVETGPHKVPALQKKMIRLASNYGKFTITATQMLESMIHSPIPTRAEASDVANAILDGSGAIMLSGETAAGKYPIESVKMMDSIAREIEPLVTLKNEKELFNTDFLVENAISSAAVKAAVLLNAPSIIAFTQSGATALCISKYKFPKTVTGLTFNHVTFNRMAMYWGIMPAMIQKIENTDHLLDVLDKWLLDNDYKPGDITVITSGLPLDAPGTTNFMKIHRVKGSKDILNDHIETSHFTIHLDQSLCTLCNQCIKVCPAGIFKLENNRITSVTENQNLCMGDKTCQSLCKPGAIRITPKNADI